MNPETVLTQDAVFILRRTQEELPTLALAVPVVFALVILSVIVFFRQRDSFNDLLRAILPQSVLWWYYLAIWLAFFWAVIHTAYLLVLSGLRGVSYPLGDYREPLIALVIFAGLLVLAWVVSHIVLLCRNPRWLIADGAVVAASLLYLTLGMVGNPPLKDTFGWWMILVPFLLVGLAYVGMMYFRDAQSIHPLWAAFLGACRCIVYATLAAVFLLPGCQYFDISVRPSRVLVLFDVSGSMATSDDIPIAGQDPRTLLSRQDKVIRLLTEAEEKDGKKQQTLLERLIEKSPIVCVRFGDLADDEAASFAKGDTLWTKEQWRDWLNLNAETTIKPAAHLKPQEQEAYRLNRLARYAQLRNGTDVGGSALQAFERVAGGPIQAVIIFSDGKSNKGTDESITELVRRASDPKKRVHVFTVGVGEFRQPVRIRVEALRAPATVRPDAGAFNVRVPVFGDGLRDQEFDVYLTATRTKDKTGAKIEGPTTYPVNNGKPQKGKFQGSGQHPYDEVVFTVNLEQLMGIDAKKDTEGKLQGSWEFVARVPRHKDEPFPKESHENAIPTIVDVIDKKLRVLLFAAAANRDYQFVRTMFYRETLDKRVDLSIFLQSAEDVLQDVDQDVKSQNLLTRFPDSLKTLDKLEPKDQPYSLKNYDVIIAFDPDWSALRADQTKLVREWVDKHTGGVIFVAGPINSYTLARPGGDDIRQRLEPITTIFPVISDSSIPANPHFKHSLPDPYALKFAEVAKSYEFLKLNEKDPKGLSGWDDFFWGGADKKPEPGKKGELLRGFHGYHVVLKLQPGSQAVAYFDGPPDIRINDGQDEHPYMALMGYGKGKTFFIGSMELWRLRLYKEAFHERFWLKLARYVGSASEAKRYGQFVLAPEYKTKTIPIEAIVLDKNEQPMPPEYRPIVHITKPADAEHDKITPAKIELKAKDMGKELWNGTFVGQLHVDALGRYEVRIDIAGANDNITHAFVVAAPDIERGDLRTDFVSLHRLATEVKGLPKEIAESVKLRFEGPRAKDKEKQAEARDDKQQRRLFVKLGAADVIPDCLVNVEPERQGIKGKLQDLWDEGLRPEDAGASAYTLALIVPAVIGLFTTGLLLFIARYVLAIVVLSVTGATVLTVFLVNWLAEPNWVTLPLHMSWVLAILVTLLSIEWLTRKLLKLA